MLSASGPWKEPLQLPVQVNILMLLWDHLINFQVAAIIIFTDGASSRNQVSA